MAKWTVRAIQVGSIDLDRSAMTHFKGKGERITVPIWCAGATDGIHKVIVDTGIRDLEEYRKAEPGVKQTPDQVTTAAIKRVMGWEPDDIDIVINTHLHCDHSGSNREFKNAKFYVQKKEWEAAFNPRRRLSTINFATTRMQLIISSGISLREIQKSCQD